MSTFPLETSTLAKKDRKQLNIFERKEFQTQYMTTKKKIGGY
jgi:hypothetical protein